MAKLCLHNILVISMVNHISLKVRVELLWIVICFAGCAMKPAEIASRSTASLCAAYSLPSHPNYYDVEVKRVLTMRGQDECTTPQGMAQQREFAAIEHQQRMQMLMNNSQLTNQLLQMGAPRVIQPATPVPAPITCVSRAQGSQVVTNCN